MCSRSFESHRQINVSYKARRCSVDDGCVCFLPPFFHVAFASLFQTAALPSRHSNVDPAEGEWKRIHQRWDEIRAQPHKHAHTLSRFNPESFVWSYLSKASQAMAECEAYHSIHMQASRLGLIIRAQKRLYPCNLQDLISCCGVCLGSGCFWENYTKKISDYYPLGTELQLITYVPEVVSQRFQILTVFLLEQSHWPNSFRGAVLWNGRLPGLSEMSTLCSSPYLKCPTKWSS